MRLSTQQYFFQGVNSITDLNSQVSRAQQQISSGRQVLTASDDPASAARILRLESQIERIDQFQKNIDFAESNLEMSETALTSVQTALDRVRELVIRAENGALSNSERRSIAIEIQTVVDELFALSNTRNDQGEYIFAGFSNQNAAYVQTGEGEFQYQGDNGIKRLQISESSYVTVAVNGEELFESIPITNSQVATDAAAGNSGTFQIVDSQVSDRSLFDTFYPEDYVVTFNSETAVVPNAANYSVTRVSDGSTAASNVVYDPNVGVSFDGLLLSGAGAPTAGDQFSVSSLTEQNMLTTIAGIGEGILNLGETDEFSGFIAGALDDIASIQEQVLGARTRLGVNLGRLENTRNTLLDRELSHQSLLSEVRDLDYAAAISNLSFISFVLEASQASFSRISNLSLFNYLR